MQTNTISTILSIVLIVLIGILMILSIVFLLLKSKENKKNKDAKKTRENKNIKERENKKTNTYNKQSIFDFMEFDSVTDNMIIQKDGKRYIMIVECQGVNYYLMSQVEKVAVEEGFNNF
ncbi:MAG: hypothetical protein V8R82_08100 [Clostridia bacterium]